MTRVDAIGIVIGIVGLILSAASLVLAWLIWKWSERMTRAQEFLLREQDSLARAVAHLQVQEKNGVMRSNADWLAAGGRDAPQYRIQCLVQDSLSVLRMLRYAPPDLLDGYFASLNEVLDKLEAADGAEFFGRDSSTQAIDTRPYLAELQKELERWSTPVEQQENEEPRDYDWVKQALWTKVGSIQTRINNMNQRRGQKKMGA